jgi:hypothetical protein
VTDVRSQRLCASVADAPNVWVGAFETPPGTVILLKSWAIYNTAATAGNVFVVLVSGGLDLWLEGASVPAGTVVLKEGWLAMNPGDYIQFQGTAGPVRFFAFGAVLAGGPSYPELPVPPVIVALPAPPVAGLLPAPPFKRKR